MTTRNLSAVFAPASVALVGASRRPGAVGDVVTRNLLQGGFTGQLMTVNPHEREIDGVACYASVADLPTTPDLAVIVTPAATVPGLVGELGARGCPAAVVISAGFEGLGEPASLRQEMLDAARPNLLRIVGPNCLGILSPSSGLNASFAKAMPPAGRVALIAQSGAVAAAAMDWAPAHGVGFSHVVSVGDCADVDVADVLDYLALDPATDAILLYVEAVGDGRKFMSAARAAAHCKPVAVLKAGRSVPGAKAALSHTGALAGAFAVYSAAFRRAGLLQVDSLSDLLQAGGAFAAGIFSAGDRLAVLTNGGGAGVLTVDALDALGERVADLSPATLAALGEIAAANWSHGDPVDILGDARPDLYGAALKILLAAPEVDAAAVLNCPTAVGDSEAAAAAVVEALPPGRHKPVLAAWLGGEAMDRARLRLSRAGVPAYEAPEDAARAFAHLTRARRNRELLVHAPSTPETPVDTVAARRVLETVLAEKRMLLSDPEARAVLRAYGVPVISSIESASPQAAGAAAASLGGPVALKVLSPDITHKSDVGGVRLDLHGPDAVEAAAFEMQKSLREKAPEARLSGFIVEPLVIRREAQELIAGVVQDPTFGPVVMVGQGGVAVQVLADRAFGLPPLNDDLAREMIGQTRVSRLLAGFRGRRPANLDALSAVLIALGRLACDFPEIGELDINPLLCDAEGVLAVDARIAVSADATGRVRPAIRPYPADLAHEAAVGGERLRIRPIRPTDAAALSEMVDACTPEDRRRRFCVSFRHLPETLACSLTQIDYDRQMALAAEDPSGALLGVGWLATDPEGFAAEFAILVRSDRQHHGLGALLLNALIGHAQARGVRQVWGETEADNQYLIALADDFGFTLAVGSDRGEVRLTKTLSLGPAGS
jgi:acetyltransferase